MIFLNFIRCNSIIIIISIGYRTTFCDVFSGMFFIYNSFLFIMVFLHERTKKRTRKFLAGRCALSFLRYSTELFPDMPEMRQEKSMTADKRNTDNLPESSTSLLQGDTLRRFKELFNVQISGLVFIKCL